MQIIVFGATGRTGQIMCREASKQGWDILAPTHAECDLRQPAAVSDYVLAHPDAHAVVNCAALSGLEACLDDPLSAHLINALSPSEMALACRHTGARFVHLSTDYVLDGRKPGKKKEDARCKPINLYGESKREGELQIMENLPESLILRVSWICGNPARPAFVESTLTRALRGEALAAVADKESLPTHAADIARVVLSLLKSRVELPSPLHVTSSGAPLSWRDCAAIALNHAVALGALPTLPHIASQKSDEVSFFRTPRPRFTAMDNSALLELGIPMPTAEETLHQATHDFLLSKKYILD